MPEKNVGVLGPEECKALVAEFSLNFIKALLKSTPSNIDHSISKQSLDAMYRSLVELLRGFGEVSYIVSKTRGEEGVLFAGALEDTTPLSKVMIGEAAQFLESKFLEYMDRRHLFSITIKEGVTPKELFSFISLMDQPIDHDNIKAEKLRLTAALAEKQIENILILWRDEMVGEERRLSWRADMVLSRMSKAFFNIPVSKQRDANELAAAGRRIIRGIMGPIRSPQLLREILINLDLVAVTAASPFGGNIWIETIDLLDQEQLVLLAKELQRGRKSVIGGGRATVTTTARQRAMIYAEKSLSYALRKIATMDFEEGNALLEELYRKGELRFDDLSPTLRYAIETQQKADEFIQKEERFLILLENIQEEEGYWKLLGLFSRIASELLKRGRFESIRRVLEVLTRHSAASRERPLYRLATHILEELEQRGFLQQIKELLRSTGNAEEAAKLASLLDLMMKRGRGPSSVP